MNTTIVVGECPREPEVRMLPSGTHLVTFNLRAERPDGGRTSVPVTVWEPPTWLESLDPGEELAVLGWVRRRFYRTGDGGTGSRVEIEAEAVARTSDKRRMAALRRRAVHAAELP